MFDIKVLWCSLTVAAAIGAASSRYVFFDPELHQVFEKAYKYREAHPRYSRELQGGISLNTHGDLDIDAATTIENTDSGTLSAIGSISGIGGGSEGYKHLGAGLVYDSDAGHQSSLQLSHIPNFGDTITGAGKMNLWNSDDHNVDVGASITRSYPNSEFGLEPFNSYGGNIRYHNDELGATLSAVHTPVFDKTDVSAMADYNVFRDRTSSVDLFGGVSRSFSPSSSSSWGPSGGIKFS